MSDFLKNLNKLIRSDEFIGDFAKTFDYSINEIKGFLKKIGDNFWFDTMDEDLGLPILSRKLDLLLDSSLSTVAKRKLIEARYKNKGKVNEELLQKICDSWRNGAINVEFNDEILIKFVGVGGIPSDVDNLKKEIEMAKPAYLMVKYAYAFLYWQLFNSFDLTWEEFESADKTFQEWQDTIFKP